MDVPTLSERSEGRDDGSLGVDSACQSYAAEMSGPSTPQRLDGQLEQSLKQVLSRIDGVYEKLDNVVVGQKKLEKYCYQIYQDMKGGQVGVPIASSSAVPFSPSSAMKVSSGQELHLFGKNSSIRSTPARVNSRGLPIESAEARRARTGGRSATTPFDGPKALKTSGPPSPICTAARPLTRDDPHSEDLDPLALPVPDDDPDHGSGFWPRKEFKKSGDIAIAQNMQNYSFQLVRGTTLEGPNRCFHAVHPDSWSRAIFDFVSMAVLLYDSILIPYNFAWHLPFEGWVATMAWSTLAFWSIDLLLGFCTGFHEKDKVVMDVAKITKRYLQSSFLPNLIVVVVDLIGNVQEMYASSGSVMTRKELIKLARFIKLNRVLRLSSIVRTGKVAEAWDWLATLMRQWGVHEQFDFMSHVCKLVFYIVWVNHLGGCLWHMIGSEAKSQWYKDNSSRNYTASVQGDAFDYMLGFYWSASSMIAGGSIMAPRTDMEMIMTVFCVVFGFIFSSVLISSLLTTVMEYSDSNKEQYNKLKNLRQFLYQHSIDSKLAMPIVKQVHERMQRRKHLSEGEVDALMLLSQNMRSELWYYIYKPCFLEKSFFAALNSECDGLIKDICMQCLDHGTVPPGSRIFAPGLEATGAYYVYYGKLDYQPASDHSDPFFMGSSSEETAWHTTSTAQSECAPRRERPSAKEGDWISEMALWVHWMHRGWLDAKTACEIMTVEVGKFVHVIGNHPEALDLVRTYCNVFYNAMKEEPVLSDLHCVSHHSVVSAMPQPARIRMSQGAMDVLVQQQQWSGHLFHANGMEWLKDEIDSGACDLMVVKDGVRRVVNIVALNLIRKSDGAMLAEIGKIKQNHPLVGCQTPGTKVKSGEFPKGAVDRLLKDKMGVLRDGVILGCCSVDATDRVSRTFSIKSKYMRTLFNADLIDEPSSYMQHLPRKMKGKSSKAEWGSRISRKMSAGIPLQTFGTDGRDPTPACEAFVFAKDLAAHKDTTFIFSWLQPEDFKLLSSPQGLPFLKKWVDELDLSSLNVSLSTAARDVETPI